MKTPSSCGDDEVMMNLCSDDEFNVPMDCCIEQWFASWLAHIC